jgi:hypothetical protein
LEREDLSKMIRKQFAQFIEEVEEFEPTIENLEEAKRRKVVVRGGKRVKKFVADKGQKMVGGKAVKMGAAERVKRGRGARKAAIKRKSKQTRINKKTAKSNKRRKQYGLK